MSPLKAKYCKLLPASIPDTKAPIINCKNNNRRKNFIKFVLIEIYCDLEF